MPEIPENKFADFELDRELLNATALRSSNRNGLIDPIEIAKHKIHNFNSAQCIDRAQ